jgi:hypothetical protein
VPYKDEGFRKEYDRARHMARSPEFKRNKARRRRIETKLKVLSYYGKDGILLCCWSGCDVIDIDMLCLDHIDNNGHEHRKLGITANRLYEKLLREEYPEGYQTLCSNHNLKKEILRRRELLL